MQLADIEVGVDYAVRINSWQYGLVRIHVLSADPKEDAIEERSGGGFSGAGGSYANGRKRRCVRARVVKGNYQPYRAYGASEVREGGTGLIVPVHIICTWEAAERAAREREEAHEEAEHAGEEAERRVEAILPRLTRLNVRPEVKVGRYGRFEGYVEVDLVALEQLVDRAEGR